MEKQITIDSTSNIGSFFIPWQPLINELFTRLDGYKDVNSVYINLLSGGYSGASVAAVFPKGHIPITVKIDNNVRIKQERKCCLKNNMNIGPKTRFAHFLFPIHDDEIIEKLGGDGLTYSLIVYTYGFPNAGNDQKIISFDEFCRNNKDPFKIQTQLSLIKDILINKFYKNEEGQNSDNKLFDITAVEWNTFLPQASTAASLFPGWRKFINALPEMWTDIQKKQNPVPLPITLCHGDLRSANILTACPNSPANTETPELFIIDFGSIGYFHPLTDFARLEADLLFRLALNSSNGLDTDTGLIDTIIGSTELVPSTWEKHPQPFIRFLFQLRSKQVQPIAELCQIAQEPITPQVYQLLLLRHATRFLRYYNNEFILCEKRHLYLWYVLRLFQKILIPLINNNDYQILPPFDDRVMQNMSDCGVTNFFWGSRRNQYKQAVLCSEANPISLIAHTGKSFLDDTKSGVKHSGVFYKTICEQLETNPHFKFQIILINPYSIEGSKLGIAEARGRLQGPEVDDDYHRNHTELFMRFDTCIESYRKLKTTFPDKIDLRISHYSPDASILLSPEYAFIEPYLVGNLSLRYTSDEKMNMPELLVKKGSALHKVAQEQFMFLWERGITLSEYESRKEEFISEFMRSERLHRKMIALHESWFAVDPIVGCPNHCDYCFLTPFKINGKSPFIFRTTEDAYERLQQNELFMVQQKLIHIQPEKDERLPVPVACGNYTEMTDTKQYEIEKQPNISSKYNNNEQLMKLINRHVEMIKRTGNDPIFCIITKKPINKLLQSHLKECLSANKKLKIAIFVSLSFLPASIENLTRKDHLALLKNFILISKINSNVGGGEGDQRRIAGIHFWRPLLKNLNDKNLPKRIEELQLHKACCSVAIGLKLSKRLIHYIESKNGLGKNPTTNRPYPIRIPEDIQKKGEGELFDPELKHEIINAAKTKEYPLFLNTSCAVSYAFGRPDYNATFKNCTLPHKSYIEKVMGLCGISTRNYAINDNRIRLIGMLDQEKQTFIRQMLGIEVEMDSIIPTHEWSGNISMISKGKHCRDSHCPEIQRSICRNFYDKRAYD